MKIRNVNVSLLLIVSLSGCATQSGLRTFVNSDDFPKTSTQVILDCSITTLYEENGAIKEGFSADFNVEVCEAFADEFRSFMSAEAAGKVLEPVVITLGAQYGGDLKKPKILIDESEARVDGDIELPMLDGRTIAYSALPQGDLPHLINKLSESEPHSALRTLAMYDNSSYGITLMTKSKPYLSLRSGVGSANFHPVFKHQWAKIDGFCAVEF